MAAEHEAVVQSGKRSTVLQQHAKRIDNKTPNFDVTGGLQVLDQNDASLIPITTKFQRSPLQTKKGKDTRFYSPTNRYYMPLDDIKQTYFWRKE